MSDHTSPVSPPPAPLPLMPPPPVPAVVAPKPPLVSRPWSVRAAFALFALAVALIVGLTYLSSTEPVLGAMDTVGEWVKGTSPFVAGLVGLVLLVGVTLAMYLPLGLVVVLGARKHGPLRETLGLRPFKPGIASLLIIGGYVLSMMVNAGWVILLMMFGVEPASNATDLMEMVHGDAFALVAVFLMVVVVAPIVEEGVFRGVIYPALKARWGMVVALGVSSALFGALHLDWRLVLPTGVVGLVAAIIYEQTRSLWASVAFHAFNNGSALVLVYLLLRVAPELVQ